MWFKIYTAVLAAYFTIFMLLVIMGMLAGVSSFNSGHWHITPV